MPVSYTATQVGSLLTLTGGRPGYGLDVRGSAGGNVEVFEYGFEPDAFTGIASIDATAVDSTLILYQAAGAGISVLGSNQYDVLYVIQDLAQPGDAGVLFDGRGGDDFVSGGWGADTLRGGTGADRLYGYGGNDKVGGGSGNDEVQGGEGADSLYGDAGSDNLFGDVGKDLLIGGAGNDRLFGGDGADRIDGGDGRDRAVFDGDRAEYLIARTGDTTWTVRNLATGETDRVTDVEALEFSDSAVPLTGLAAYVRNGEFLIEGNAGEGKRDYVEVSANDETHRVVIRDTDGDKVGAYKLTEDGYAVQRIDLGAIAGADVHMNWKMTDTGGYRVLYGSAEDDIVTLTGTGSTNVGTYVELRGGNDRIVTTGCEDEIDGGDGNDFINAGRGEDTIYGGAGDDTIDGGSWVGDISGNKEIYGNDGDGDLLAMTRGVDGFTFADNGDGSYTLTEASTGQEIYVEGVEYIAIGDAAPVLLSDYVGGMV